jgi:hypothetical protein
MLIVSISSRRCPFCGRRLVKTVDDADGTVDLACVTCDVWEPVPEVNPRTGQPKRPTYLPVDDDLK